MGKSRPAKVGIRFHINPTLLKVLCDLGLPCCRSNNLFIYDHRSWSNRIGQFSRPEGRILQIVVSLCYIMVRPRSKNLRILLCLTLKAGSVLRIFIAGHYTFSSGHTETCFEGWKERRRWIFCWSESVEPGNPSMLRLRQSSMIWAN